MGEPFKIVSGENAKELARFLTSLLSHGDLVSVAMVNLEYDADEDEVVHSGEPVVESAQNGDDDPLPIFIMELEDRAVRTLEGGDYDVGEQTALLATIETSESYCAAIAVVVSVGGEMDAKASNEELIRSAIDRIRDIIPSTPDSEEKPDVGYVYGSLTDKDTCYCVDFFEDADESDTE